MGVIAETRRDPLPPAPMDPPLWCAPFYFVTLVHFQPFTIRLLCFAPEGIRHCVVWCYQHIHHFVMRTPQIVHEGNLIVQRTHSAPAG
ncbi:hypothetical protein SAMN05660745_02301 [Corynebacterium glucuronolyticum]|nr:hypothetical protein CGLUCO_07790 [Corynebacterium glucuronolyticum DSM 44120]SMB79768.1 hypothetical protein SAMN05660745_02301 [Corynebacterium glucuronolyticum]